MVSQLFTIFHKLLLVYIILPVIFHKYFLNNSFSKNKS